MASSNSRKETWIRSFNVTEPTKHEKGFTVYKVTYRAFRLDKAEEVVECIVWKRYNDFKKLHQALSLLHYHLRRPEKFPEFAKARFFGRFEERVVEERRQSALRLLEFTVKVPPLAKSEHFVNFFKGGETVTRRKVSSGDPILQPQPVHAGGNAAVAASIPRLGGEGQENMEGPATRSLPAPLTLPGNHGNPSTSDGLGGVWLHRQQEEDDPGGEGEEGGENVDDDSEDDRTTFSEDSVPSTPLPQLEDLTLFDPLTSTEPGNAELASLPHSNSWLFHAMDMCADLPELDSQLNSSTANPAGSVTNDSTDSGITISVPPSIQSSNNETSSAHSDPASGSVNRSNHSSLARAYLNSLRAQQAADEDARTTVFTDGRGSTSTPGDASARNRHASEDSISKWEVSGEEDYLYQAAGKISLALDNASVGNYQFAFDAYKAGVAVLLQGVVGDKSKARREAVRRKTAQYLMKAEDIYNKYLSVEATNARRWESQTVTMDVDPSSAHLRVSAEELKNLKVLGCINSVMLVLDMTTYQSFIIKSHSKCSVPNTSVTTRVPTYCPYMVQLYRYFETESSVYLLLEHATGGKLWDYASPFLKQQQHQNSTVKQEHASSLKSSALSRQRSHSGSSRTGRGTDSRPGPTAGGSVRGIGIDASQLDPSKSELVEGTITDLGPVPYASNLVTGTGMDVGLDPTMTDPVNGTELGVEPSMISPVDFQEANERIGDSPPKDLATRAEVSSISSIEGKLEASQEVSSSYVNLIDACGDVVTGNANLGDPSMDGYSDSNLNDLVNQSSNYGDFDVHPVQDGKSVGDMDDSLFSIGSNADIETVTFRLEEESQSTPVKINHDSALSVMTPHAQPPSMALFSIDSIESPNEYSIGEMGDASVFGFSPAKEDRMRDNAFGGISPSQSAGKGGSSLDPSKVIAEALAVVQEVEEMRKEEAKDAEKEESGLPLMQHVKGPSFGGSDGQTFGTSDFGSYGTVDVHAFGTSDVEDNLTFATTSTSNREPPGAPAKGSQAFVDTTGFGVFSQKETVSGVDLAEFFDAGSHPHSITDPEDPVPLASDVPSALSSASHRPLQHSASLFDSPSSTPRGRSASGLANQRSHSLTETPSQGNGWATFFESANQDTKGGFGFDSEIDFANTGLESNNIPPRVTSLPKDDVNQETISADFLDLPDVPAHVPTDVDSFDDIFIPKDGNFKGEKEQDLDVFDFAQHRQRPDGATSEELNEEKRTGDSLGKQTKPRDDDAEKNVTVHVNPLASEDQLVISKSAESTCATTFVSVGDDDPAMTSTGIMKDYPSSCTVSAQSTPQHTFKYISSSPDTPSISKPYMSADAIKSQDQIMAAETNPGCEPTTDEAADDSEERTDDGLTPTHSRASTLKRDNVEQQESNLPSLSRLFSHLDDVTRTRSESSVATLPESCVCIWASEILMALATLHAAGIICRDLNPDNILLAEGGHIRLTYFSQWQWVDRDICSKALDNMFTAPEVTGIYEVGPACDWWSYGAILFELLSGQSLLSCHISGINSHTQLCIPEHISPEAKDLLRQLLQVNPLERLGGGQAGAEEVKSHPFFRGVNWSNLLG